MEKFRWAYIGSGNIARATARSITRGNHAITAVYSRNYEKARTFADSYKAEVFESFDGLLKSGLFDAVYIATPHTSHIEYSLAAMQAGCPVLCEKPVGISVCEADAMIKASNDNGVYFCEAMWTWFSDVALTVKKWINENRLGRIRDVHFNYSFPGLMMRKDSRVLTPETAGGALLDVGIYPITYCYNLFGSPKSIKCEGVIKNGIDVAETVILGYGEFDCTLEMSLSRLKEDCRIVGEKGEIKMPFFHVARTASLKCDSGRERFKGKTDYLTEFTRAADEIRSGLTQSRYVPHSATRECLRIIDECRRQMNLVYPFERE